MTKIERAIEGWRKGAFSADDIFYYFVQEISSRPIEDVFLEVPLELQDSIKSSALSWRDDGFFFFSGSGAESIPPETLARLRGFFGRGK